MKNNYPNTLSILVFFVVISLFSSCRPDTANDVVVGQAKEEFDMEDQKQIGDFVAQVIEDPENGFEVLEKTKFHEMYHHLNTMIQQITNTAIVQRRDDFNWKVTILKDDNELNAFILPGGHLYIYSGLLKFLHGEHELVGVMAHEVAYADSDALIEMLRVEFGSKKLSKILSDDDAQSAALDIANGMKGVNFTNEDVMQADMFCADIVCEFVWDGQGLLSVLKRGGENVNRKTINWLEGKPADDSRIQQLTSRINNHLNGCGMPDSTFNKRYFEKVLEHLPE
ncbi:MAG: M48 family metalloprotease [Bacteroidota bacterium]